MSTNSYGGFDGYRQLVMEVTADLRKLRQFADELELSNSVALIDEILARVMNQSFDIAIVGEFKRGKSTLINALLGQDILPTDILPCSATLNRITYGVNPQVRIDFHDGTSENVPIDQLTNYVTKLTSSSEQMASRVREATVFYPVNYCMNNVDIIDTPGLNDDKNMTDVTLSVLPKSDAAIMTIMATSPFSDYERDFLENRLLTSDMGRVLFVVTRIDSYDDPDDVERVLESITSRIENYVLAKAARTYGEGSEEYAVYRRKIGKPRVFGISAKQALRAKMLGDNAMLEESRFPAFERELERFLTEDRGAVLLQVPVNRIISGSGEVLRAIEMRRNALSMQKEEFEAKQAQAMAEINEVRQRKTAEIAQIDALSRQTFQNLQPLLANFWPDVENAAYAAVDKAQITADDIKTKEGIAAASERISELVRQAMSIVAQNYGERVEAEISRVISQEMIRLEDYNKYFINSMTNVHGYFTPPTPTNSALGVGNTAVSSLLDIFLFPGLGGAFLGFRQAGWKGAAIGGGAGLGMSLATAVILGLAGMTAGPALLVASIVATLTGTFSARWVLERYAPNANSKIETFKQGFKEALAKQLAQYKTEGGFVAQIQEQVNTAFGNLRHNVEHETESILNDTERTIASIRDQLMQDRALSDKQLEDLERITTACVEMQRKASGINQQLLTTLDR